MYGMVETYWYLAIFIPSWISCCDGLKNFGPFMLFPKNAEPPIHPQLIESLPFEFQRNQRRLCFLSWTFRKLKIRKKELIAFIIWGNHFLKLTYVGPDANNVLGSAGLMLTLIPPDQMIHLQIIIVRNCHA